MTPIRKTQQVRLQRAQARRRALLKWGGVGLLLAGVLWGMSFLPWALFSSEKEPADTSASIQLPEHEAVQQESTSAMAFSFYESLPKMAVKVDVEPLPVHLAQPVVLVAGTFGRMEAAQKELQRLARKGFDQLQIRVFEKAGRVLYQLRSSPLDNKLDVIRLRNQLKKAGAQVLVVKLSPAVDAQASHP